MLGLNDDSYDDGGSPTRQPPSPPRLVNLNVGDESLTTTLTKALHCEDSIVAAMTPVPSGNTLSSGASNGKTGNASDATNKATMIVDGSSVLSNQSNPYADSLGSNPYADSVHSSNDNNYAGKTMEVTVTVLSLHGIVAERSSVGKKKLAKKQKKRAGSRSGGVNHAEIDRPTVTIVASFSQNISKDRVFLTHVPSLPVSLTRTEPTTTFTASAFTDASTSLSNNGSVGNGKGGSSGEMLQPAVHWSSMDDDDAEAGNALSTLQFKRRFVREGSTCRYVPQTCPINLSISRNGRMALLGKVNLIINGEERGKASVTVPITSSIRPHKSNNPVRQVKKIRNMGKYSPKQSKSNEKRSRQDTPMVSIKGDNFQFGLKEGDAILRMLVHVHDPDAPIPKEEEEVDDWGYSVNEDDNCRDDDSISDNEDEDSIFDNDCLSMEGDDPSILGCNDYHNVNRFAMESNELHTLRQQLVQSEQTNNILQMELANAQYSAQFWAQAFAQSQNEKGMVETQLKLTTANADTLLKELNVAKSESEALPYYETRVTELLQELRKRDLEVGELSQELKRKETKVDCLRGDISELNGRYRERLVDSLLWDNDDKGGNDRGEDDRKDRVGEKSSKEQPADSKPTAPAPELGASLELVAEDKEGGEDCPVQDEMPKEDLSAVASAVGGGERTGEDKEKSRAASPSSFDDATSSNKRGAADSRGEETRDDDASPTELEAAHGDKDASAKKETNVGSWGVRLLGGVPVPPAPATEGSADNNTKEDETAAGDSVSEAANDTINNNDSSNEIDNNGNSNNNGSNYNAASMTKQAREWGIRGIGASLLSMEERMRERQAQFQEQQLKEQRSSEQKLKAKREMEAVAAQPGLGGVLISRLSNHGVKATAAAIAESNEETEEVLANIEKALYCLSDKVDGGESEHSNDDQSDPLESNESQLGVIGNDNESTTASGIEAPAMEGAADSILVPSPSLGGTDVPVSEEPPTPYEIKSGENVEITPLILEVATFLWGSPT